MYILLNILLSFGLSLFAINEPIHSPFLILDSPKIIHKTYDLLVGKNKIGEFKLSKTMEGNTIRYQALSDANFRILSKTKIVYDLDCTVKNGLLIYSHCKVYKNGKLKDDTEITWMNDHYQINKKGELSTYKNQIPQPAISLYFEEPSLEEVKVFSEREAIFKSFKRNAPNRYKLTPVGKRSGDDYTYNDGQLQEVLVNYVITNFRTVLRD